MSWPAKYFTTPLEPDSIAAAVGSVFPYGEPISPGDVPARGYQGFDAAYQFNLKGTPVYLLVIREGDTSKVVLFGIPSMLGKSKFVKTLESAVSAVPGAQIAPFPGGPGGFLNFVSPQQPSPPLQQLGLTPFGGHRFRRLVPSE